MTYEANLDEEMRKPWPDPTVPIPLDALADEHEGAMLVWLLPIAMGVIAVAVIAACNHFGWLQ